MIIDPINTFLVKNTGKNKITYIQEKPDYYATKPSYLDTNNILSNKLPHDDGYHPNINYNKLFKECGIHKKITPRELSAEDAICEYGQIRRKGGRIFNRHTTYFARHDMDWYEFGKYLKERYKDIKDVDIHCFACSSGEEAYTLAILLNHIYHGEQFTIHASDIDEKLIEKNISEQNSGVYIDMHDCNRILDNLGIDKGEMESERGYLDKTFAPNGKLLRMRPEVTDKVEFSKKNILTSTDCFSKTRPSIVLCRNMWPYVNHKLYSEFAKELYESLPKNSIVVIGNYDYNGEFNLEGSNGFPQALRDSGFKPIQKTFAPWYYMAGEEGNGLVFEKN